MPPGENPCTTHSAAQSHLVRFAEGLTQQTPVLWQQLRVALGDVPLPLLSQVDLSSEKWTRNLLITTSPHAWSERLSPTAESHAPDHFAISRQRFGNNAIVDPGGKRPGY